MSVKLEHTVSLNIVDAGANRQGSSIHRQREDDSRER